MCFPIKECGYSINIYAVCIFKSLVKKRPYSTNTQNE